MARVPGTPLAGTLALHLSTWERLTQNQWVLRVLRAGFRLPWEDARPPLLPVPPKSTRRSAETAEILAEEVQALLTKGAIEPLSPSAGSGFYGHLFCVRKANGGWRPVLDLSPLNRFLQRIRFKMETAASIRESVRENDWAASIDLTDAYFHITINQHDRKFLRFVFQDQAYQFKALPFGLSLAPWIFTRVVREYLLVLRSRGVRIHAFLDDWLILASSQALCHSHVTQAMDLALDLGFRPNLSKSELTPSQRFTYLGMVFDTVTMTVAPSPARLGRLSLSLTRLSNQQSATARDLSSLLGQMESLAPLLHLGRLHKRPFQRAFRERWEQASQSWDTLVPLDGWLEETTQQWLDQVWLSQGVPIHLPDGELDLYTDASHIGWGAHVDSLVASGQWSPTEAQWHINLLELEAVARALQEFLPTLTGKAVRLFTDNTTVAFYVNKQGGARSQPLSVKAERILLWCQSHQIALSARHVPGKLNIVADALSRPHSVLHTEWTLVHSVLQRVWETFHRPMIDLFATQFSFRLQTYVSPVPDPQAWAVDALSISWTGLMAYAFPPFPLLTKVIRKARTDRPCLLLVAPLWPAQPWYPDLAELALPNPLRLQLRNEDLVQPRSGICHGNVGVLDLHVWHLCASPSPH